MTNDQLEKYSSAITLSDMEIFVFPELMYALVLANIMSSELWQWRNEDCFKKIKNKSTYRKILRLKQFIMDEFDFNLDLNTWGLTHKDQELKRFENVISPQQIEQSNALFGYTGDKYYFDVDIRKHFGLDKYDGDIIPYWKTETVEAMKAFRHKKNFSTGAGECVSLAALYAAAMFVVCEVPLEDIFMILTPLHSQNFLDVNGGILTNNRRIVTKPMWFNGTVLSNKAQRAMRNERVTILSHCSGYIHCFYEDATISKEAYQKFTKSLNAFLQTDLTPLIFANFLRSYNQYQKYFQFCRDCHGKPKFISAENLYKYEHGSNYRIADETHDKLLEEIADDDLLSYQLWERIRCDEFKAFLEENKIDLKSKTSTDALKKYIEPIIKQPDQFINDLCDFVSIEPNLPSNEKKFLPSTPINFSNELTREEIIEYLSTIRNENSVADLAFYAYRDMASSSWEPFIKAALERNPVAIELADGKSIEQVYEWLCSLDNSSIYAGQRLAQPDELANFLIGDGLEKAFLLAEVIHARKLEMDFEINCSQKNITLIADREYSFTSEKNFDKNIKITGKNYKTNTCHVSA